MKKFLLLSTIFVATGAFAFGGMVGGGSKSKTYDGGVVAIGIHIDANSKKTPDIKLLDCNGNGVKGVDNNCYCNQGYTGTYCETKLCETGSYCGMDGDNPLCCPSDHICTTAGDVLGTCWRAESGCTTNADCETAEGCAGGNCYCNLGFEDLETPAGGTCEPKENGVPSNEVKDANNNVIFAAGQFLIGPRVNWLSAKNWCLAQNKKMVHLSSFKIASPTNENCMLPCLSNENCAYQVYYSGTPDDDMVCLSLGGDTLNNASGSYYEKLYTYIPQALNGYYYWTDNDSDENNAFNIDGFPNGNGEESVEAHESPLDTLCE